MLPSIFHSFIEDVDVVVVDDGGELVERTKRNKSSAYFSIISLDSQCFNKIFGIDSIPFKAPDIEHAIEPIVSVSPPIINE
ncbi:hypothetical protein DERP_010888 [Dermatophagoides pteronyssinus]|uniref:Uncharacterized protein n=1 Tax=Dermatophagoides pteronyssinus TaxID=6956 RepID=A0ABQ8JUN2_DERPT|nr:hypothetical protein DERP_010888 [Dermatophagoides pteronyssinus]